MSAPDDLEALEARTRALLASDRLTPPTRRALTARLERRFGAPLVMSAAQMRTLQAVCLRVIPEAELVRRTALAEAFDASLVEVRGRGWRYAEAPPDLDLHRSGLDALDTAGGSPFAELAPGEQDALLGTACAGELASPVAMDVWFEELTSALVELYYAHPLVQVAIGYDGMADAPEIRAVGLAAVAAEARHAG